ncbi:hypothetical protein SDC9_151111 [bioreactor metagenome]|uniref:Uncharacterized protein n=1 Tax=bioreactor metagenome TaxID=1076179 RepID=A0A645ER01_9ZZZZ
MQGFQDDFLQRRIAYAVRGTGLAVLVGGANVVDVLFIPCWNGFTHHTCAALATEYHAAEKLYRILVGACAGVQAEHFLNAAKIGAVDDRFVVILNDDPFALRFCETLMHLVARSSSLTLRQNADVDRIFEDADNGTGRP